MYTYLKLGTFPPVKRKYIKILNSLSVTRPVTFTIDLSIATVSVKWPYHSLHPDGGVTAATPIKRWVTLDPHLDGATECEPNDTLKSF